MVENICLEGKLERTGEVKVKGHTFKPVKPLFIDEFGTEWLGKELRFGDENIREFIGSNLIKILKGNNLRSPEIRVHESYEGYLTEYLQDMEPAWCRVIDQIPSWVPKKYRAREYLGCFLTMGSTEKQTPHIVPCFVNDDFDRNPFNYGLIGKNLVVLDQARGIRGSKKRRLSFGGASIYVSKLVRDETRRDINFYTPTIEALRTAESNGYFNEVLSKTNLTPQTQGAYLKSLKFNLRQIEAILEEVFQFNREHMEKHG